jgi:hypothetical protein
MATIEKTHDQNLLLLKEGARSYDEAMMALMAFRHEVHNRITRVVTGQISALGDVIGVKLGKEHVQPYTKNNWPDTLGQVDICVQVQNPAMRDPWMEFFAGLAWWKGNEEERCFGP